MSIDPSINLCRLAESLLKCVTVHYKFELSFDPNLVEKFRDIWTQIIENLIKKSCNFDEKFFFNII